MIELRSVRIKGTIDTSRYGALSSGDILRTDAGYAKYLVDDLHVGEYYPPAEAPAPPVEEKPHRKYKKRMRP